jgi:endoglucanase
MCLFHLSNGQGYMKAKGKEIVDAEGKEILLRGTGLGGWMLQEPYMLKLSGVVQNQKQLRAKITELIGTERTADFYNAWLQDFCRKSDIDSMAAWGFNSVRLPFHYNLFTLPIEEEKIKGHQTWIEQGFAMVDSLLDWCEANKIYLILDMHATPGGQGSDIPISDRDPARPSLWQDEQNKIKTIALWRKIAERYANEKWIGAYDLINETNWGFADTTDRNGCAEKGNGPLRSLLIDITKAIREVDENHMVIIEGNCWGNNYSGVFPLWDGNMVLSFHKYWNENDQGAIQQFVKYRDELNVPVWMGESGENSNHWFTSAIALLERNNIGWAWWPLKKMGINNPFQVRTNEDYNRIVKYWKGEGKKPSADVAYQGLMQLANDSRTENTIIHNEVVDAMFRQVNDTAAIAFRRHRISATGSVYAVEFDLGRLGNAYHSLDSGNYRVSRKENIQWNKGWMYRNEAVDIDTCKDVSSNGYKVSGMQPGEWLQYTINVASAGKYSMIMRTATKDKVTIGVIVNGVRKDHSIASGSGMWRPELVSTLDLKKGINRIRILNKSGELSFNSMHFKKIK